MLTLERTRQVVTEVGQKYGIKNAYLFGSYAKNEATETSDVDIIMERGDVRTYDDYFDMHEELEKGLGTKVDLVSMDGVKPRFYELIKNDRILLYGA